MSILSIDEQYFNLTNLIQYAFKYSNYIYFNDKYYYYFNLDKNNLNIYLTYNIIDKISNSPNNFMFNNDSL